MTQLVERDLFPLSGLASIHRQLAHLRADGGHGFGEPSARGDLRELVMITDQDDLGAALTASSKKGMELDGAGHPGLVDDHHAAIVEAGRGVGQEAFDRERGHPGALFEFPRRLPGRRGTDDTEAAEVGVGEEATDHAHRVRLAGPGAPNDDLHSESLGADATHQIRLIYSQAGGVGGEPSVHRSRVEAYR